VLEAVKRSQELIQDTINGDADAVAEKIHRIHNEVAPNLRYNSENALACTIMIAYYAIRDDYTIYPEQLHFSPKVGQKSKNVV